jgi:hypothetical protein
MFDVDWVDVSVEPHHVEQFRAAGVRVYEVSIDPGTATQFHRHDRDTVYVITAGGRFRSEEPGHQRNRTSLGRSTSLLSQLRLLATRTAHGWLRMANGTVILQPHHTYPLIHRVLAHPSNAGPIRMVGVELPADYHPPGPITQVAGLRVEKNGSRWRVYRLRLNAGKTTTLTLSGGGVLVVATGSVALPDGENAVHGSVHQLPCGTVALRSSDAQAFDAVIVPT